MFSQIKKRPYLTDKNTYVKVDFIGTVESKLVSELGINKIQFYPHRNGISVQ